MSRSLKKGVFVDPKLLARIEKMNADNKKINGKRVFIQNITSG